MVGTFPNGKSTLILIAARQKYVTYGEWAAGAI